MSSATERPARRPAPELRQEKLARTAQTHASAYVGLLRPGLVITCEEADELVDSVRRHIVEVVARRLGLVDQLVVMLGTTARHGPDTAAQHTPAFVTVR